MEVTAMTRLRAVEGGSSKGSPENFILATFECEHCHAMAMMVNAWMKRNWRPFLGMFLCRLLTAVCFGGDKGEGAML